jgi:hypothetical protein
MSLDSVPSVATRTHHWLFVRIAAGVNLRQHAYIGIKPGRFRGNFASVSALMFRCCITNCGGV